MLITIVGVFIIVFIVVCGVYCLGHWHGKKRCMIENGILFGKDAERFICREIENRTKLAPRETVEKAVKIFCTIAKNEKKAEEKGLSSEFDEVAVMRKNWKV